MLEGQHKECEPADNYCYLKEASPHYGFTCTRYDIRKPCDAFGLCHYMTEFEFLYFDLESIRDALHVSNKATKQWV